MGFAYPLGFSVGHLPKSSDSIPDAHRKQKYLTADTGCMNKAQFLALAASCGAFAAFIATGGEALVMVERFAANLPL